MTLADGNICLVARGSISKYRHFCLLRKHCNTFRPLNFNRDLMDETLPRRLGRGEQSATKTTVKLANFSSSLRKLIFNSAFICRRINPNCRILKWAKTQQHAGTGAEEREQTDKKWIHITYRVVLQGWRLSYGAKFLNRQNCNHPARKGIKIGPLQKVIMPGENKPPSGNVTWPMGCSNKENNTEIIENKRWLPLLVTVKTTS